MPAWAAIGETGVGLGRPSAIRPEAAPRPARPVARGRQTPRHGPRRRSPTRARLAAEALRPAETTDAWTTIRSGLIAPRDLDAALCRRQHPRRPERAGGGARDRHRHPRGAGSGRRDGRAGDARTGRWRAGSRPNSAAGVSRSTIPPALGSTSCRRASSPDSSPRRSSEPTEPARLLALLKHPLAAFGMDPRRLPEGGARPRAGGVPRPARPRRHRRLSAGPCSGTGRGRRRRRTPHPAVAPPPPIR